MWAPDTAYLARAVLRSLFFLCTENVPSTLTKHINARFVTMYSSKRYCPSTEFALASHHRILLRMREGAKNWLTGWFWGLTPYEAAQLPQRGAGDPSFQW